MALLCAGATTLWADSRELRVRIAPGGTLHIDSEGAELTLVEGSDPVVELRVTSDARIGEELLVELVEQDSGAKIAIRRPKGRVRPASTGRTEAQVRVPRDVSLAIRHAGGDLRVEVAIAHDARIDSAGGSVELADIGRGLRLRSSGGSVRVGRVGADVSLVSSGGGLELGDIEGSLAADTSGGRIQFGQLRGGLSLATSGGRVKGGPVFGALEVSASGGGVELDLASSSAGGTLRSSGGGLRLRIAPGAALDLDLQASGGGITNRLAGLQSEAADRGRLRGRLNGGGPLLSGAASGGGIVLETLAAEQH